MRKNTKKINVGIGFVTGRKNFKKVAKAYIQSFAENDELNSDQYALHLFVAYDLKYKGTQLSDYQITEDEFHTFIGAISNDIINWKSVKEKMEAGGVTYASSETMDQVQNTWVEAVDGMKFISGANLAICLKDKDKTFPFYNPPGARGEDTFLSTCIGDCRVLKVGCYTFHDAYSAYRRRLDGFAISLFLCISPNQIRTKSSLAIRWRNFLYKNNRAHKLDIVLSRLCAFIHFKSDYYK